MTFCSEQCLPNRSIPPQRCRGPLCFTDFFLKTLKTLRTELSHLGDTFNPNSEQDRVPLLRSLDTIVTQTPVKNKLKKNKKCDHFGVFLIIFSKQKYKYNKKFWAPEADWKYSYIMHQRAQFMVLDAARLEFLLHLIDLSPGHHPLVGIWLRVRTGVGWDPSSPDISQTHTSRWCENSIFRCTTVQTRTWIVVLTWKAAAHSSCMFNSTFPHSLRIFSGLGGR